MSEKEGVEKPKIEPPESTSLYTVELCSPIKEQLSKIKVCEPHIEVKLCGPLREAENFSDIVKLTTGSPDYSSLIICPPVFVPVICQPMPVRCQPIVEYLLSVVFELCVPSGPCIQPWPDIPTPIDERVSPTVYARVNYIGEKVAKIDEIAEKVEHLLTEVKDIKSKVR